MVSYCGDGWWERAACRSSDPDLFFPVSSSGRQIARAKAVCAHCTVRRECLDLALATGPVSGVWGGTSEDDRRLIRQRQRKARVRAALAAGRNT
ncbi:MAG TPA: WhiB family transcriptional regulator [Streptosporangiaceae bacterium]|nr:WhiB family transcriptional regulator [Streptosporangiaceae bacterium]